MDGERASIPLFGPAFGDRRSLLLRDNPLGAKVGALAPMAKLDKASAYEAGDCRFESCSERQFAIPVRIEMRGLANGEVAERLKALPC